MKRYITLLITVTLGSLLLAQTKVQKKPHTSNLNMQNNGAVLQLDTTPKPLVMISGAQILEVDDKDGKLMVRVSYDGKVTYGDGYHADASAKQFWQTLAEYWPEVCNKPEVKK